MSKKNLDDLLKEFQDKSNDYISSNRNLYEGNDIDDAYNVDIHIWRKPGMGNSLQTIAGNKISIMTATASYLTTLLNKDIISLNDLDYMIELIKENYNGNAK